MYVQLLYLAYIHNVKPHDHPSFNNMEFINEYCMVALAYIMLYYTNILALQDSETLRPIPADAVFENWIEWTGITLITFMTLFNFAVMVKISYHKLMLKCKKKKAEKSLRESIKKREELELSRSSKALAIIKEEASIVGSFDSGEENKGKLAYEKKYRVMDADISEIIAFDEEFQDKAVDNNTNVKKRRKLSRSKTLNRYNREKRSIVRRNENYRQQRSLFTSE